MKKSLILFVLAGLVPAVASAQDSLDVNYMNNGDTITASIYDSSPYVNVNAFVGSFNVTWDAGPVSTDLPLVYCVDLSNTITLPADYPVTVDFVDDASAWLITNEAYPVGGLTYAQDAGLQLAIWDVTYPGVSFSNVTGEGGPQVDDPTYWESVYLAADDYGAKTSFGVEFDHIPGVYGQNLQIAPPPGSVPGPLALVPFAAGLFLRRRSR
jgi:hypothetical protein